MDYSDIAQAMINGKELKKMNSNIKMLYHGSNDRDIIPDINKCNRNNDFGP